MSQALLEIKFNYKMAITYLVIEQLPKTNTSSSIMFNKCNKTFVLREVVLKTLQQQCKLF